MISEADVRTAKGCLDWLHCCKAECCRVFKFNKKGLHRERLFKGYRFRVAIIEITSDLEWYYELHGAKRSGNDLVFTLDNYYREGDSLFLFQTCDELTEDNWCGIHDDKPEICSSLSLDHTEGAFLTPNCLFKHKKELERKKE